MVSPKPLLSEEAAAAQTAGKALVALESTLIAHGMPWPYNFETALLLEQTVREAGATPATCAILQGTLRAGLNRNELEGLARKGALMTKASRRDMAYLMAREADAATTVAGTMIIAHAADIRVFATGGIGGVHRGAEHSFDISADLQELARTPVAVVCAGAKSILDLALTLEYLETMGVPVLGYQTDELPAFYSRHSGLHGLLAVASVADAARTVSAHWRLGGGGVVLANPIPAEQEAQAEPIEAATQQALRDAEAQGIKGKALTPFLLQRIVELSGGDSLQANIALALNNARLAAALATALTGMGD